MSDEFEVENRTFKDGHDPMWTALDKSDDDASSAGGGSMQFYNSSAVTTVNGMLRISTKLGKTNWNRYDHVDKTWKNQQTNFTSGMMQSWEKFCFTGGIVEVDVIFPGDPYVGGLWPAVWMLGNLGRATYEASTNNIWPWSYDTCDRELQQAQTLSACNNQNHFGMKPKQGRGATEIDIAEVMTGYGGKPLPGTNPPVKYPYCDLTLQVCRNLLVTLSLLLLVRAPFSFFGFRLDSPGCPGSAKESSTVGCCTTAQSGLVAKRTYRILGKHMVQGIRNARKHFHQSLLLRNVS